jgi:hypothetical protein
LILEARHRLGDILERLAGVLVLQRADIEPERADRGRAVGCRIACIEQRLVQSLERGRQIVGGDVRVLAGIGERGQFFGRRADALRELAECIGLIDGGPDHIRETLGELHREVVARLQRGDLR